MQISPVELALPLQPAETGGKQENSSSSFAEMLNDSLKKLNDTKVNADNMTIKYLTGEIQDFHQVAIAMQEASLTMKLAVEVRNKIIEAYQEISRMQV